VVDAVGKPPLLVGRLDRTHTEPNQGQPPIVLLLGVREVHDCLCSSDIFVIRQVTNGPDPKRFL
jgi:hypothetical protein